MLTKEIFIIINILKNYEVNPDKIRCWQRPLFTLTLLNNVKIKLSYYQSKS